MESRRQVHEDAVGSGGKRSETDRPGQDSFVFEPPEHFAEPDPNSSYDQL